MVGEPSHVKQLSLIHVCKIGLKFVILILNLLNGVQWSKPLGSKIYLMKNLLRDGCPEFFLPIEERNLVLVKIRQRTQPAVI